MFYYNCFSRKRARELTKKGFNIVKIVPNHQNPNLDVYLFEWTDSLDKILVSMGGKSREQQIMENKLRFLN